MTMAYLMNSAMRTSTLFGFHNYKNEKKKQKYQQVYQATDRIELALAQRCFNFKDLSDKYVYGRDIYYSIACHRHRHSFISTHILHIQPTTSPLSSLSIFLNLYLSITQQIRTQYHNSRWRPQEDFQNLLQSFNLKDFFKFPFIFEQFCTLNFQISYISSYFLNFIHFFS